MKDQLTSLIRHAFTGWILAAVAFLTAKLALTPDAVQAVESALNQIGAGLLLLIVTLAPIVGRLFWSWAANGFRTGSGETTTDSQSSGRGLGLWVLLGTTVVLGGLPSCSPEQLAAARAIPIKGKILTQQGAVTYDSKSGLGFEVDARSAK